MTIKVKNMSRTKPSGRSTSITNAFFNGILPYRKPSESDYQDILDNRLVEIRNNEYICVYCGKNEANSWDHIRPLIKNKKPTGYIHEISNLIPACTSCNSSKGNKEVDDFFATSKRLKNLTDEDLEKQKSIVKRYIEFFKNKNGLYKIDFENLPKEIEESYEQYNKALENIHSLLADSTSESKKIAEYLKIYVNEEKK